MPYTYTKIPADAFQHIQINAGVLVKNFDPESVTELDRSQIIGATTGGISFNTNIEYSDFGEDIDNVPNNTKQLKRILYYNPQLSGTFVSVNADLVRDLVAAADYGVNSSKDITSIKPRTALYYGTPTTEDANTTTPDDFFDVWFVGDYSQFNSGTEGGFIAIRLRNSLSTGGFSVQTSKDEKGTFDFEFTGHYDIFDLEVPFEVYIKQPDTADLKPSLQIVLTASTLRVGGSTTGDYPSQARIYYVANGNTVIDTVLGNTTLPSGSLKSEDGNIAVVQTDTTTKINILQAVAEGRTRLHFTGTYEGYDYDIYSQYVTVKPATTTATTETDTTDTE